MSVKQNGDERELEQWLARELKQSAEYIDDDGFTDRVMSRLPELSVSSRTPWLRPSLVVVFGLLAGLVAVLTVPVQPLLGTLLGTLLGSVLIVPLATWLQVGAALSLLAMAGTGYWIWREM